MKIAVIGATGNVGQRISAEALSRGHSVTAIARTVENGTRQDGATWIAGDLAEPAAIAGSLAGHDVIILSVPFRTTDFARALEAVRASGVPRLLVVGGAASLETAPGVTLLDDPAFPAFIRPEAEPARDALVRLRAEQALDWTFLSPAMMFGPGERTGRFRLGTDRLIVADDGSSTISYEDYAIALLDEVERPQHSRARFTIGY